MELIKLHHPSHNIYFNKMHNLHVVHDINLTVILLSLPYLFDINFAIINTNYPKIISNIPRVKNFHETRQDLVNT